MLPVLRRSEPQFELDWLVPQPDQIVPTLVPLLEDYKKNRAAGEGFGDYCQRLGKDKICLMV